MLKLSFPKIFSNLIKLVGEIVDTSTSSTYKKHIEDHFNEQNSQSWNWVFYGDSITHGAAHTHGYRSFQEIFHERVRYELKKKEDIVINTGTSGQTAINLAKKEYFGRFVSRFNPQVVFLLIGTNDINVTNGNIENFKKHLDSIIQQIIAIKAIPVVQNYPPIAQSEKQPYIERYEWLPKYNEVIKEIAEKYGAIFIDHNKYWKDNCKNLDDYLGETIHPGEKGHLAMAVNIFKELNIYSKDSACCNIFDVSLNE